MSVHQEYQDHHSEEEDGDLYEKIGNTEKVDEKFGGGIEKRRCELKKKKKKTFSLFNSDMNDVIFLTQLDTSDPIESYNYLIV